MYKLLCEIAKKNKKAKWIREEQNWVDRIIAVENTKNSLVVLIKCIKHVCVYLRNLCERIKVFKESLD